MVSRFQWPGIAWAAPLRRHARRRRTVSARAWWSISLVLMLIGPGAPVHASARAGAQPPALLAQTQPSPTPEEITKHFHEEMQRILKQHGGGADTAYLRMLKQRQGSEPDTSSSPDSVTVWIPLTMGEWAEKAPSLLGKDVEVSGNLLTMPFIRRTDTFSNSADMVDEDYNRLVHVLFDRAGDDQIKWMMKNKCSTTCKDLFIRGRVVRPTQLRMKDISFDSHAGVEAPGVAIAPAPDAESAAGVAKVLLPAGMVPAKTDRRWATEIPTDTLAAGWEKAASHKSMWEKLTARSDAGRERDLDMDRGNIPGPTRPADYSTSYRSIRDTRLSNVFAKYPWNSSYTPWPRVVLVVEEATTGGTPSFMYLKPGDAIRDRCFRVSARLWTGPAHSEDIAPFDWCLSEMRFNVSYSHVPDWAHTPKTSMTDRGPPETMGPNPPYLPAADHHFSEWEYADTIMLGNLFLDMGFDCRVPDGRVWVLDHRAAMNTR
jgi:hypothetical protein